jgi:prefoldin subunit 5
MTVFKLIALGVILLAIMAAIGVVVAKHDAGVRVKALAPWQPLIVHCNDAKLTPAQCNEQWIALKTANETLQVDFKKLDKERQECSAGVTKLGKDTKDTLDAKDKQIKAKQKVVNDLQAQIDAIDAELAAPAAAGESCEATLKTIDTRNDELGARRLRDYPPKPAGPDPRRQPAAAAGARPDSLRISP